MNHISRKWLAASGASAIACEYGAGGAAATAAGRGRGRRSTRSCTSTPGSRSSRRGRRLHGREPRRQVKRTVSRTRPSRPPRDRTPATHPTSSSRGAAARSRQQVDAGLVQASTTTIADVVDDVMPAGLSLTNVDGAQYGLPYDLGAVGLWYNKDLLAQAGIDAPADDLGGVPGGRPDAEGRRHHTHHPRRQGDQWTAMFWWAYLAIRESAVRRA